VGRPTNTPPQAAGTPPPPPSGTRATTGAANTALQELHEAALEALLPVVHEDCEFTWTDPGAGERFHAHLTLAFADIPAPYFQEVLRFVRDAEPVGPASFLADTVQLLAFTSDRWNGRWWERMRWRLVDSWPWTQSPVAVVQPRWVA
jgi:hypothetical protein